MDWNSSSTVGIQSDRRIFAGKLCLLIVHGIDHFIVKLLLTFIPLSMAGTGQSILFYLYYLYTRTSNNAAPEYR